MLTLHQHFSGVCQSFYYQVYPSAVWLSTAHRVPAEKVTLSNSSCLERISAKNCRVKVWLPSLYLLQTFLIVCTHHKYRLSQGHTLHNCFSQVSNDSFGFSWCVIEMEVSEILHHCSGFRSVTFQNKEIKRMYFLLLKVFFL